MAQPGWTESSQVVLSNGAVDQNFVGPFDPTYKHLNLAKLGGDDFHVSGNLHTEFWLNRSSEDEVIAQTMWTKLGQIGITKGAPVSTLCDSFGPLRYLKIL